MQFSLKKQQRLLQNYGPCALVTGASSGIGKEIAHVLAGAGFNLVLSARSKDELDKFSRALKDCYKIEIETITADLSIIQEIRHLLTSSLPYDIGLFVPAAGFGTSGEFLGSDLGQQLDMLQVNCRAVIEMTHHFSERFVKRKKGGIIFLSSIVGFQGVPYAAHYAATKAYIQSFAEALAIELKPHGVKILSAAPGPVNSGFAKRANMQMGKALKPTDIAVPILEALGKKTTVYPGLLTKILIGSLRTVPRWAKIRIMKMVMSGMTKHQRPAFPFLHLPGGID